MPWPSCRFRPKHGASEPQNRQRGGIRRLGRPPAATTVRVYNVGALIALLASPDAVVTATTIADHSSAKTTFSKVLLGVKGNLLVMLELIVGGVVETYWCY